MPLRTAAPHCHEKAVELNDMPAAVHWCGNGTVGYVISGSRARAR